MKKRPFICPSGFSHKERRKAQRIAMHRLSPLPLWERVDWPEAETGEGGCR